VKRASYWIILLLTLFICFILGYQRSVVARSSYVLTSRKGQLIAQIEQKENDLNPIQARQSSMESKALSKLNASDLIGLSPSGAFFPMIHDFTYHFLL